MLSLNINGRTRQLDVDPDMPLLWALRDIVGLRGTKYGCGLGLCGACTVHVDGAPTRSCITPCGALAGHKITTIEAVGRERAGRAIQDAWRRLDVVQCGYCQSGQIMSATALVRDNTHPTDSDIDVAMTGNVCRCATYVRIRAAIKEAAQSLA
jgi:isoquinoline 1-oxidoreductase alpha subunit